MDRESKRFIDGLRIQIDGQDLLLALNIQTSPASEAVIRQITALTNKGIIVWVHARPNGTLQVINSPEWKQKIEAMNLNVSSFQKIPILPG